ncbi:MAG: hypothetical protein ACI8S6_005751, partial [Myxococcota bacterium]
MERALPWLVLVFTALVFLPILAAGFVWDDNVLVVENLLTDSWSKLPALLTTSLWGSTPTPGEGNYYRPLLLVSLLFDRSLFGLSPAAHHAHSLLWHLLAVGLGWRLLRRWLPPGAAAAGLALFAVHPLQVEPVAFIAARNDLMAAALLLAALLALGRDKLTSRYLIGGGLAIAAAALCKESVLLAPALYAAVELARTGRLGTLRGHAAVIVGLAVAVCARILSGVGLPARADAEHLFAATPRLLALYAERLLVPCDLLPGLNLAWPPSMPWWALCVAVLLCVGAILRGRRQALAGLLFAALSLAPAAPAVAHVAAVPDRYAYLPLLGLGMALAATLRGASMPIALGLWALLGALSAWTLPAWTSDITLWSAAHARHGTAYTAAVLARVVESDTGDLDAAAALYAVATAAPMPMQEACFSITTIH